MLMARAESDAVDACTVSQMGHLRQLENVHTMMVIATCSLMSALDQSGHGGGGVSGLTEDARVHEPGMAVYQPLTSQQARMDTNLQNQLSRVLKRAFSPGPGMTSSMNLPMM